MRRGAHPGFHLSLAQAVALAAVYVVVGRLGLLVDAVSGFAALVWPPSGVALAALVLAGVRIWPGVALGALVVNLWAGASVPVACGIAVGNTLEAVVGTIALRRLVAFRPSLERLRDVFALLLLGAVLSTMLSATAGVLGLFLGGIMPPGRWVETWRAWWIGDMLSDLAIAPLLLAWGANHRVEWTGRRLAEVGAIAVLLVALAAGLLFGEPAAVHASLWRKPYLLFPLLFWPAFRFGPRGATTAGFVVSSLALFSAALGRGPFVRESLAQSLAFAQVFIATVTITCLAIAAASSERAAAIRRDVHRQEILSIVSHDLGTPLSTLRISSGILLRDLPLDEWARALRKQIESVQRSTDRMRAIVRDLLDLTAIDAGTLSLRINDEEAGALVHEAITYLDPLAAEKSQMLRSETPTEPVWARCDRERVLQVFTNVIGNAIKFTPRSGTITVRAEPASPMAHFTVTDTGPGIAPADLPFIFERFWRAAETARWGTGLGLSIAKGIVETSGGRIWVESRLGRGTTFHFTLPLASAQQAAPS